MRARTVSGKPSSSPRPGRARLDAAGRWPGLAGGLATRALQRQSGPGTIILIVMVTAKAEETDELVGLAVGADDYVTKPYSIKILIELIKKAVRCRRQAKEATGQRARLIESQGVTIDRHGHRASHQGEELPPTPTEFRLLRGPARAGGPPSRATS